VIARDDPPGFIVSTEAAKAASDNGFRNVLGVKAGWIGFASTTARGEIWIAAVTEHGPWLLSVSHPGVAAELGFGTVSDVLGPGGASFVFASMPDLYVALDRAYRLGVSLPDNPLNRFEAKVRTMPRATEAERLIVHRVGQDIFREALLDYWGGRCPMTGISDTRLLRASHIVAWAECDDDAHRLDVHNGLLLSALWDAAFDCGAISFADDGEVLVSPALTSDARRELGLDTAPRLVAVTPLHHVNLNRHRAKHGFQALSGSLRFSPGNATSS
jgi:hypothetical protein